MRRQTKSRSDSIDRSNIGIANVIGFCRIRQTDLSFITLSGIISRRKKSRNIISLNKFRLGIKKITECRLQFRIFCFIHMDERPEHLKSTSIIGGSDIPFRAIAGSIVAKRHAQIIKSILILRKTGNQPSQARSEFIEDAVHMAHKISLKPISLIEKMCVCIIKSGIPGFLSCQNRIGTIQDLIPVNRHTRIKRQTLQSPYHARKTH